jgi:threonine aldolase
VRAEFGEQAEVFPVFNGTGANVLALTALMPRWGAIIASGTSHIHTDEGAAPERVSGLKLFTVPTPTGKLTTELVDTEAFGWGDEHRAQPLAVSITNTTEVGTLYTPDEVRTLADHAHNHGMALHLDGARVWNAAAALGTPLRAFTADAGVDVLSLGGTKNGLLGAEAIIVLDPAKSPGLTYLRKMNMQLASKMRFISAQLLTLFDDDLGIRSATHANAMAARLRAGLDGMLAAGEIPAEALRFSQPTMANAVFALIGNDAADRIRERVRFYDWDRARGEVRWMCAFDTTEANVDAFLGVLREELNR